MAITTMSESQKEMLVKLRRRMELTPQVFGREEKGRFYRALDALEDPDEPKESYAVQDPAAFQILLASLRMLVIRLGKNHGLYQDVLDALRSLAPEMAGETERLAEQHEQQRNREIAQSVQAAQERFGERFPWLAQQLDPSQNTDDEKEMEGEENKGFLAFVFDQLQTALDREELTAYLQKKQENSLTHDEVVESRKRFMERAESRIEVEFQKEKPDELLTARLHARAEIMRMGWNPDDMEMVDTFLSILNSVPEGKKAREQGEIVLAKLLTTKVNNWEDRQTLIDKMCSYCEVAANTLYPDGNVDPAFIEASAKLLNAAARIISEAEYPNDPQFSEELNEEARQEASRNAVELPRRGSAHLILDLNAGRIKKDGYMDEATGKYYDANDLSKLPKGIYFAQDDILFRVTGLSQLDDLLAYALAGNNKGQAQMAERIRRNAKQYFIDQPLELCYKNEKERDLVISQTLYAQERLLASDSDKYGMPELQKSIQAYQMAKQKGDDPAEIAKREETLIQSLRQYMENVPERIGRTTGKNLESACDLLCGLQRERNFRKKNSTFESANKPAGSGYLYEMEDCQRVQAMVEMNAVSLRQLIPETERIGHLKEHNSKAYVRMVRALKECAALTTENSIHDMNGAYMELRQAATEFGKELGWNAMDALAKCKNDDERKMVATVQKLSRMGRNMSEELKEASKMIENKTASLRSHMYAILDPYMERIAKEEEKRKEQQKAKEIEKEKIKASENREPVIKNPVLKKK
ncbi:MAG: hypothetical protein IKO10_09575 [Lachnospiraceae bacterium]|nr:hypothetical protein [Lachnospiraceae bacterium]